MTTEEYGALQKELEGKSDEEVTAVMKSRFRSIKVHAPRLNEHLHPDIYLFNEVCPKESETKNHCGKCDHFLGYNADEEGRTFSYGAYEGFCEIK